MVKPFFRGGPGDSDKRHDLMKHVQDEMGEAQFKMLIKEAFKEYLNETVQAFGWFSLRSIAIAAVGAVVIFILWTQGLHK